MDIKLILFCGVAGVVLGLFNLKQWLYFTKCCLIVVGGIIEILCLLALYPFQLVAYGCGWVLQGLRNAFIAGMRKHG